jgi:hypothetical protein
MATLNDQFAGIFTATGAITKRQLTPWSLWRTAHTMSTTVTATVWVVDSVHGDTTNSWADTLAAVAAGRTNFDVLVLDVTNDTNCSRCF